MPAARRPNFIADQVYAFDVHRRSGSHRVEFMVADVETGTFRCRCYVGRRATTGGADTAVILHGLFDDDAYATRQHLLGDVFQVVSVDLPGHGDSGPTDGGFTLAAAAKGIAALPYLRPLDGRALLIGNSLGGIVARMAAIGGPETLAGVCLIDPPIAMNKLNRLHAAWTAAARQRGSRDPEPTTALARNVLGLTAFGGDPTNIDYAPIFTAPSVPILIVAGHVEQGSVIDDADLDRLHGLAGNALTSCRMDGGHNIWIDQHADVVHRIRSWWRDIMPVTDTGSNTDGE